MVMERERETEEEKAYNCVPVSYWAITGIILFLPITILMHIIVINSIESIYWLGTIVYNLQIQLHFMVDRKKQYL